MKLRPIPVVSIVFICLLAVACGSLRTKAPVVYGSQPEVNKIALISTYMLPFEKPEAPVADASTFNKKVDKLQEELNKMLKNKADQYYLTVAKGLANQLNTQVVYGEEMRAAERFSRALRDEDKEALKIAGAAPFNTIYVGEGGINVLSFEKGQIADYLENNPRMRTTARGLTKDANADAIAFSVHQMVIEKPRKFGAVASAKLVNNVYIFNDRGEIIGHGYGETEPVDISGDDPEQYRLVFDQYPSLQNLVFTELAKIEEQEAED